MLNSLPDHPTRLLAHHPFVEWDRREAERDSATRAKRQKRRGRLHRSHSGHQQSWRRTGSGTCWGGSGRGPHSDTGQSCTHQCPSHTCRKDCKQSASETRQQMCPTGTALIQKLWEGRERRMLWGVFPHVFMVLLTSWSAPLKSWISCMIFKHR